MESDVFSGRSSYLNYLTAIGCSGFLAFLGLPVLFDAETAAIGASMLALAAFIALFPVVSVLGSAYRITSQRVSSRRGIVARSVSEVEVSDIRNVRVDQSALQRILGIGDVGVSTAGQSGMEITFHGVRRPAEVAELIRTQRKAAGPG
jgi:uncharacterized membrane protein YdbT with pleckstrin-like domain